MNKKYILILLSLILSFALMVGCSDDKDLDQEGEDNQEDIEDSGDEVNDGVSDEDVEEEEEEDVYAPDFELKNLDGETYKLSELEGKKVILNFWATTCPYCVTEMPDLTKLSNNYNEDLVLLAINIAENEDTIREFLEENPDIDLNILLDSKAKVASLYGARAIPLTIAINTDGTVETGRPGAMNYEQMESMYEMLN